MQSTKADLKRPVLDAEETGRPFQTTVTLLSLNFPFIASFTLTRHLSEWTVVYKMLF